MTRLPLSLLAAAACFLSLGACDSAPDSADVAVMASANPSGCTTAPTVTTSVNGSGYIVVTATGPSIASLQVFSDGASTGSLFDQSFKSVSGTSASWTTSYKAWTGTGTRSFRSFGAYSICEGHVNISPVGTKSNVAYDSSGPGGGA